MASVHFVGTVRAPVIVIDDATQDAAGVTRLAARMGPFPKAKGNSYPGLRRFITAVDAVAINYTRHILGVAVPAINSAFGAHGVDLLEASFSMVTTRPEELAPEQRAPHFDSVDPDYLAVLHYVSGTAGSGTAFYRQRATGIEQVGNDNCAKFVGAARHAADAGAAYVGDDHPAYQRIGMVDGVTDRLIVYPGSLLHSGMIPPDATFSDDPATGRLTGNFFVRVRRQAG